MMPLKTRSMKFINKNTLLSLCLFFLTTAIVVGQEIIQDTVKTKNAVVDLKRQKIDGVIATVGDFNILDSDIDKSFVYDFFLYFNVVLHKFMTN